MPKYVYRVIHFDALGKIVNVTPPLNGNQPEGIDLVGFLNGGANTGWRVIASIPSFEEKAIHALLLEKQSE